MVYCKNERNGVDRLEELESKRARKNVGSSGGRRLMLIKGTQGGYGVHLMA